MPPSVQLTSCPLANCTFSLGAVSEHGAPPPPAVRWCADMSRLGRGRAGRMHLFRPHNILLLSQFKNQKALPQIPFPACLRKLEELPAPGPRSGGATPGCSRPALQGWRPVWAVVAPLPAP